MLSRETIQKRLEKLNAATLEPTWVYDPDLLDSFGLKKVRKMLQREPWCNVVCPRVPTYPHLTSEFLSTVRMKAESVGPIQFKMAGRRFDMSLDRLDRAFGCEPGGSTFIDDMEVKDFWKSVTVPNSRWLGSGKVKCSSYRSIDFKVIHKLVANSLFPRSDSTEKVNNQDLVVLWAILRNKHVSIAYLWKELYAWKISHDFKTIQAGPFVTFIARELGLTDQITEAPVHLYHELLSSDLRSIGCVELAVGTWLHTEIDASEDEDAEDDQEDEDMLNAEQMGPGSSGGFRRNTPRPNRMPHELWDMSQLQAQLTSISDNLAVVRQNQADEAAAREEQFRMMSQWAEDNKKRWEDQAIANDANRAQWEQQIDWNFSTRRFLHKNLGPGEGSGGGRN